MLEEPTAMDLVRHSDELLEKERLGLVERVGTLRRRVAIHRGILEQLEAELAADESLLREIEELADQRPQLRLERLDRQIRGRRLQEVAVEVLRRRRRDTGPVHYREWFSLLLADGWHVSGRDPLNSFLTELGRTPEVARVGGRTGLYQLVAR